MGYDQSNTFAKILRREIPANIVFENDKVMAFEDIDPKAPVHILIIPKVDVSTVLDFQVEHKEIIGEMVLAANEIARQKGLANGFRLAINCGDDAGQEIYHVHMHLLGGRRMKWPPG